MGNSREIMTFTGEMFDFWLPTSESICIEDIAHALALTNRYGGHTTVPFSVAEHCVRMSYPDLPGNPLINLLHDSAEAYIGDIPSPQKQCLYFSIGKTHDFSVYEFNQIEDGILMTIGRALGIPRLVTEVESSATKKADKIMMATEVRDLMPAGWQVHFQENLCGVEALPYTISPWTWQVAERFFLLRFKELMSENS